MKTNTDLITDFFHYGVVKVSVDSLFTLTSGKTSPVYLDHRKIWSVPRLRHAVVQTWCEVLKPYIASIHKENLMIAGTATAGIAPGYALADALGCSFIYVRDKPKAYGMQTALEGLLPATAEERRATQVVVVDDMVTTGKSLLNAAHLLKESGFSLVCGTSISRHPLRANAESFREVGLSLVPVFTTDHFFTQARELGCIQEKELSIILDWLRELDS